ncbi:PBS lyase [Moorella naiadis]|uniref:DVU0298 family protein n=1 Tax=Moorella naiadis (nom. illeg.) TaxID=3093670 RepID=UPI003D9C9177
MAPLAGQEPVREPTCPFCGLPVERPRQLATHRPGEMPVGACTCGAVYACDVTGHNQGAAFSEALVFGCNQDWDLAWELLPDEDYLVKTVENYDYATHLIIPGRSQAGRRITGILYFIRLQPDIREVTAPGVQEKLKQAATLPHQEEKNQGHSPGDRKYTKREIAGLVRDYRVATLLNIARQDRRVINDLQRLLYATEELLRLRAADILGQVAAIIAVRDPQIIANLLQRLLASVSDPGAAGWGAVDALGEIIANTPTVYAGYIPQLYAFLEDPLLRSRALRALSLIARVKPELLQGAALHFLAYLQDKDPEARGYAAVLLGCLGTEAAREDLKCLVNDDQAIDVYQEGIIRKKTVGELAAAALAGMGG